MTHDDPRLDGPDVAASDAERADAERLRGFIEAEGGDLPAPEDAEVVGLFAEAAGAVDVPDAAWARIAAGPRPSAPEAPRRRAAWRPVLALAAAALLAVCAVALWPRAHARLPGPTVAEVGALGDALRADLSPTARLAALGGVNDARRARLLGGGPVGAR